MSAAVSSKGAQSQVGTPEVSGSERAVSLSSVDVPDVLQVDMAMVARNAVELLGATRRFHGLKVTLDLPEDCALARVSRRRAEQVMLLLLAHAAESAGARGVLVTVEPPDDFGDEGPRFHVNTPEGVLTERELQAVALSPMLVGPQHRRLARARELVDSIGGTMTVSRGEPTGITVTVELPAPGIASW